MRVKEILMAGAAMCIIATAPAFAADAPHVHVLALRKGAPVVKTHSRAKTTATTSTVAANTSVSTAKNYKVKTPLYSTYYTFTSNSSCKEPTGQKVKLAVKKTAYASLSTGSVATTISACPSAPLTFYGDNYELTSKVAAGKTDTFSSTFTGKFVNGGVHYAGKININATVTIGS